MSFPYLAQAAEQEQLQWLGGGVMQIMLDREKTGGQLTMVRSAAHGGSASAWTRCGGCTGAAYRCTRAISKTPVPP
jgi:hypothetical protein